MLANCRDLRSYVNLCNLNDAANGRVRVPEQGKINPIYIDLRNQYRMQKTSINYKKNSHVF